MTTDNHFITLTAEQRRDSDFLKKLCQMLSEADLSAVDFKTLPGFHHAHSILFDNYELNISRTPVFVHKNNFMRLLGLGEWKFRMGVYERYEIYILENACNMRANDISRHSIDAPIENHNVIMRCGTMATQRGYFAASKKDMCKDVENMFYNQNSHLFTSAKNIYDILDQEYRRRRKGVRVYAISNIGSEDDLQNVRNRMLDAVRQHQK